MSAFDYLAVLISIVLGLGVANILTGYAAIIRNRARIRSFWPTYLMMANLFLIHLQMWWSMYGLRNVPTWTFPMFLFTILQPVFIYLMSAVLVPAIPDQGEVDLEEAYFREISWFSAGLFISVVVSITRSVLTDGHLPSVPNLAAHAVFAIQGLIGLLSRNKRVHMILAPAVSLVLIVYVGGLFFDLRQ